MKSGSEKLKLGDDENGNRFGKLLHLKGNFYFIAILLLSVLIILYGTGTFGWISNLFRLPATVDVGFRVVDQSFLDDFETLVAPQPESGDSAPPTSVPGTHLY